MVAQLGLGTVQFGQPYGITNAVGQPSAETVGDILSAARSAGVAVLDTAAAYGDSESVLGRHDLDGFRIVTKTPQLADVENISVMLNDTFDRSLERLQLSNIDGLLAHNADDLLGGDGDQLMNAMRRLRDTGRVNRIGASLYTPAQADALLERFDEIDLVQVPLSAIDQRLLDGGQLARLAARGVQVHARSAFLQGLLLAAPDTVPLQFARFRPILQRWQDAVSEAGMAPLAAALAFVRDLPGVEAVLVGVANLAQFTACTSAFAETASFDASGLACDDEDLVNPIHWAAV